MGKREEGEGRKKDFDRNTSFPRRERSDLLSEWWKGGSSEALYRGGDPSSDHGGGNEQIGGNKSY